MKHGTILNSTFNHHDFNKSLRKNVQECYPVSGNMSIFKQGELVNIKYFTVLWRCILLQKFIKRHAV